MVGPGGRFGRAGANGRFRKAPNDLVGDATREAGRHFDVRLQNLADQRADDGIDHRPAWHGAIEREAAQLEFDLQLAIDAEFQPEFVGVRRFIRRGKVEVLRVANFQASAHRRGELDTGARNLPKSRGAGFVLGAIEAEVKLTSPAEALFAPTDATNDLSAGLVVDRAFDDRANVAERGG